jgi:GTPase SAR1 family protein
LSILNGVMRIIQFYQSNHQPASSQSDNPANKKVDSELFIYGGSGVGKGELIKVAQGAEFDPYPSPLKEERTDLIVPYGNQEVRFSVFQSPEREKGAGLAFYGQIRLLIVDMTSRASLDECKKVWESFATGYQFDKTSIFLVATKSDLTQEYELSNDELVAYGESLAEKHRQFAGLAFVSAANPESVHGLMQIIAQEALWHKGLAEQPVFKNSPDPFIALANQSNSVEPSVKRKYFITFCDIPVVTCITNELSAQAVLNDVLSNRGKRNKKILIKRMPARMGYANHLEETRNQGYRTVRTLFDSGADFNYFDSIKEIQGYCASFFAQLKTFGLCIIGEVVDDNLVQVFALNLISFKEKVEDHQYYQSILPLTAIDEQTTLGELTRTWREAVTLAQAVYHFNLSPVKEPSRQMIAEQGDQLVLPYVIDDGRRSIYSQHLTSSEDDLPEFNTMLAMTLDSIKNTPVLYGVDYTTYNLINFIRLKFTLMTGMQQQILARTADIELINNADLRSTLIQLLELIYHMTFKKGREKQLVISSEHDVYSILKKANSTLLSERMALPGLVSEKNLRYLLTDEASLHVLRSFAIDVLFLNRVKAAKMVHELKGLIYLKAYVSMPPTISKRYLALQDSHIGSMFFTFFYLNQFNVPQVNHVQLLAQQELPKVFHAYIGRNKSEVGITRMSSEAGFYLVISPKDSAVLQRVSAYMLFTSKWGIQFDFPSMRKATLKESNEYYGPLAPQYQHNAEQLLFQQRLAFNKEDILDALIFLLHHHFIPDQEPGYSQGYFCSWIVLLLYQAAYFDVLLRNDLELNKPEITNLEGCKHYALGFFARKGERDFINALPQGLRISAKTTAPFTLAHSLIQDKKHFSTDGYFVKSPEL